MLSLIDSLVSSKLLKTLPPTDIDSNIFTINKMKNKNNHSELKIKLNLSGDIELDQGLVDKYQIMSENFEVSCVLMLTAFSIR